MASRRGTSGALIWCLIALYGAVMVPGQGLHAISPCDHFANAHGPDADAHAGFGTATPLAADHDEGACPICAGLSQAQIPVPPLRSVDLSPPRGFRLAHGSELAVARLDGVGNPRAPPQLPSL